MPSIQKPQPLMVDGKPYYTLSSYEPVEVEVTVPFVTDGDVTYAVAMAVAQAGGKAENATDDAWLQENLGVASEAELRAAVRQELEDYNAQMAEQSKADKILQELAGRVVQAIPPATLQETRGYIEQDLSQRLAQSGMTLNDFAMQSGMTMAQLDEMLDAEAEGSAAAQAALDAWASKKQISVSVADLPQALGISQEELQQVLPQLRQAGMLDEVLDGARRNKAAEDAVAASAATYHHETEDEARARIAEMQRLQAEAQAEAARQAERFNLDNAGKGGKAAAPASEAEKDDTPASGLILEDKPKGNGGLFLA